MSSNTLIFACTWTPYDLNQPQWSNAAPLAGREKLLDQWLEKTISLNPDKDILLVDTPDNGRPSPIDPRHGEFVQYTSGLRAPRMKMVFPDNIGHLCFWRRGHRDGWGRAFCYGVSAGAASKYEHLAHIEGDSIFRHPVEPIIQQMKAENVDVMSNLVDGSHKNWIETGLMFMRTQYLVESDFVRHYNWAGHTSDRPAPEEIIFHLFGQHARLMPWRVRRGHNNSYTFKNILDLDWITHASDPKMYDVFMGLTGGLPGTTAPAPISLRPEFTASHFRPRPRPHAQAILEMQRRGVKA